MHTWTEAVAGRGADEVISSLLAFFDVSGIQGGHLIAWSDSCGGQNKNFYVVSLWQYLIKSNKFALIEHKFPEVGHSYLDSDRDFALIEKEVKRTETVFAAEEY